MRNFRGFLTALGLGLLLTSAPTRAVPPADDDRLQRSALEVWGLKPMGGQNASLAPTNLWSGLSLAEAGAATPTSEEFYRFFNLSSDDFRGAMNRVEEELNEANRTKLLRSAQSVWVRPDYVEQKKTKRSIPRPPVRKLPPGRRDRVRRDVPPPGDFEQRVQALGGQFRLLDFTRAQYASNEINHWVAASSGRKQSHLFRSSDLGGVQMLVCSVAVCRPLWERAFDVKRTAFQDFRVDGRALKLPTMRRSGDFKCLLSELGESENFSLVELPLVQRNWAFDIVLPDEKLPLAALENALSNERLQASLDLMQPRRLDLSLPRFRVGSAARLEPALSRLGLVSLFKSGANFSRVHGPSTAESHLHLSQVVQQVEVSVDEGKGKLAQALPGGRRLAVNRPFLFVIRNLKSGNFLILGRYSGSEGNVKL